MDAVLLRAEGVARAHAGRPALAGVDLALARGEVLALLGVNGAGKSTLLKSFAGVLKPDAGTIRVAGEDLIGNPKAARRLVGYLPERAPLHRDLTVAESLDFCLRLRGIRGAAARAARERALERCGIADVARRLVGVLSRGQQQRVGVAQAVAHAPAVLLLDEPTAGLDPVQTDAFHALVRTLAGEAAVVLSTHQLADVEACASRVALLHAGRVVDELDRAAFASLRERFFAAALGARAA
ncbi:MAG TPA: ABC transporter ATP-binding protein [Xanthomonadales bacterium]|nr:ABC transporter ATP-binding protein [Xanthomonadales bacterium]